MKATTQTANGTSFHNTTITATVNQLTEVLGQPVFEDNAGDDKVNFEFEAETDNGDIFTVYDWKEYRAISKTEQISWHIGGHSADVTDRAKHEIVKAFSK